MNYGSLSSNKNTYISTPEQRAEILLNQRQSHDEIDRKWTAARCKRLLRAITSRVAILRKEVNRYSNNVQSESELKHANFGSEVTIELKEKDFPKLKNRKQKVKRTYGRIRKTKNLCDKSLQTSNTLKEKAFFLPSQVLVPTPVLTRLRGDRKIEQGAATLSPFKTHYEKYEESRYSLYNGARDSRLFQHFGQGEVRDVSNGAQSEIYDKIYHAFETLLHTTLDVKSATNSKGSRSLQDMTLRVIPKYIVEQQELLQIYAHDSGSKSTLEYRDICGEIYDELENFGTYGYGWKGLRNIVRAHGLQVISDAIKERLFNLESCNALISLCLNNGASEEARTILTSFLSCTAFSRPQAIDDILCEPLGLLQRFSNLQNQTSFFYHTLSNLLSECKLPFEWLASKNFGIIWTGLIKSFALDSLDYEAFDFCETAFSLFLNYPNIPLNCRDSTNDISEHRGSIVDFDDAVKNTFSSLLTILVSISILDNNSGRQIFTTATGSTICRYDFIISFLRKCIDYVPTQSEVNEQYLLLLFANLLAVKEDTQLISNNFILDSLSNVLKNIQNSVTKFSKVAMFVCQVAQCCGKGTSGLGYDYLQLIHFRIKKFKSGTATTNFLKGIIVDSALIFARKVPRYQHVEYAASMNASYFIQPHNEKMSLGNLSWDKDDKNFSGFRWEEGIGEWVTVTPAVTKLKKKFAVTEHIENEFSPRKLQDPPHSVICRSITYKTNQLNCEQTPFQDLATEASVLTPSQPPKNEILHYESPLKQKSKVNKDLIQPNSLYCVNRLSYKKLISLQKKPDENTRQSNIANYGMIMCNIEVSNNQGPIVLSSSPNPFYKFAHNSLYFTNHSPSREHKSTPLLGTQIKIPNRSSLCSNNSLGKRKFSKSSLSKYNQTWDNVSSCEDDEDELSFLSTSCPFASVNESDSDTKSVSVMDSSITTSSSSQDLNNANKKETHYLGYDLVGRKTRLESIKKRRLFPKRTRSSQRFLQQQVGSEDELCI
ncbi:hypothetical protein OnM2_078045 [Erysiphe neolycopersici]|uniref:Uncharacterized protein n=1 Tax=Erysiphe neolycopersici TaxID=212602 RepID=A0A420HHI1_9PEZI|nr:hypothetical protein OnM2_078045 [Erysiphe neolycopersici]